MRKHTLLRLWVTSMGASAWLSAWPSVWLGLSQHALAWNAVTTCMLCFMLAACSSMLPSKSVPSETAQTTATLATVQPNIILFLVDDLGQQDLSISMLDRPSSLNARYFTPNIEKLAARGMYFSNAYAAAPVCTPSRTAILTGQSPARTHITYWTLEKGRDNSSRHPRLDPPSWAVNGAQPTGMELPALLQHAGYRTIHVGKAHFGARGTPGEDPRNFGFDINIAGHAAGAPGSYLGTDAFQESARTKRIGSADTRSSSRAASVWDVPNLDRWHGKTVWLDDVLAREASDQITRAVTEQQPFFLHFCPYGVHTPLMEDVRFSARFASLDPIERAYASMVSAVDDALGQLVLRCEELGVLDNTLIILTSDNGGLSAVGRGQAPDDGHEHTHNAPLRSGKGSAYEGGLRVPFVVAGPHVVKQNFACNMPIVGTDLYPTLLAVAGVSTERQRASGRACDGENLVPIWRGDLPPLSLQTRSILFHQPHAWGPTGPGIEPMSAVRCGDWKLIWFHDRKNGSPRFELFDVQHDPSETVELSMREPAVFNRLRANLCEELRRTGAQWSIDRSTGVPVACPNCCD